MSDNVIYLKQPPKTDDEELKDYEVPYTLYRSESFLMTVEANNKEEAYDRVMDMWNQGELEEDFHSDDIEIIKDEIEENTGGKTKSDIDPDCHYMYVVPDYLTQHGRQNPIQPLTSDMNCSINFPMQLTRSAELGSLSFFLWA